MKVVKISFLLSIVLLCVLCACKQQEDTSNRSYFAFRQKAERVIIPLQLNDSITVRLLFDTGAPSGYWRESVVLDTGVLSAHPSLIRECIGKTEDYAIAWTKSYLSKRYNSLRVKLKIGNTGVNYSGITVVSKKEVGNSIFLDGLFNIPKSDTTHVWELNFEDNYMEIHPADGYKLPEDCMVFPMEEIAGRHTFYVTFPLKLRFPDGDTLTINRRFLIDTGAPNDLLLLVDAPEQECLNQREDAVWLHYLRSYVRYYTATATLADQFTMDSLRIYTLDYKNRVSNPYVIGLNFLKRFNVFFDMKSRRMALQPHHNFRRLQFPTYTRFHYSTQRTKDGRFIVDCVGDYKANYYKTAGLRVGDEIVAMDGIPYGEITFDVSHRLRKLELLMVDIIRDGKPLTLYVNVDQNEPTDGN